MHVMAYNMVEERYDVLEKQVRDLEMKAERSWGRKIKKAEKLFHTNLHI